jgi:hypothetical protein
MAAAMNGLLIAAFYTVSGVAGLLVSTLAIP